MAIEANEFDEHIERYENLGRQREMLAQALEDNGDPLLAEEVFLWAVEAFEQADHIRRVAQRV